MDLPQPGILCAPAMVHHHRSLRDRVQREVLIPERGLLERRIPDRQWIEIGPDAIALGIGWLCAAMPFGGQAEFLHRLAVELQRELLDAIDEAHADRPLEIIAI